MKARCDSWYASIPEDKLWALYGVAKRAQWFETVRIANEEMGLSVSVSRSAYYRWLDYMRGEESERRLAQARIAAIEADALAKQVGLSDEHAIKAYKSLAAECALKSDAKTAKQFLAMAMDLRDRQIKADELALKSRADVRKDEELRLAREKFEAAEKRLAAASDTVTDATLTDEERVKRVKAIFGLAQ